MVSVCVLVIVDVMVKVVSVSLQIGHMEMPSGFGDAAMICGLVPSRFAIKIAPRYESVQYSLSLATSMVRPRGATIETPPP